MSGDEVSNVKRKNARVSVVVPVYNMEKYVAQNIESVLKQTFKDFELILVNDGSTDNSLKIIRNYAEHDERIYVIDKPNAGMASAYNAGQQAAQGKYVYFLDSDDWMEPDCLSELYKVAEQENAEVVKAGGIISEQNGKRIKHSMIPLSKCNRLITNMLEIPEFVKGHVAQWTCLYRLDFLLKNNIWCPEFPPKLNPDIDYMYHVWATCKRLYVVPKFFVHYRLDNSNSYKNAGSKMSFYLLQAHLVTRATMANLNLSKDYWYVKSKVEYQHFLYELETYRCCTNRLEYLNGISKIFKENINHGLVKWEDFSKEERKNYKLIAYMPWLYWLSSVLRFWTVISDKNSGTKTYWRFFGMYKRVENRLKEKIYLCGFLIQERKKKYVKS